ncbi:hypothetical protein J2Z60_001529 [Lactobacillus colini]|uniref:Uncharacterized protein n=1 Tax=Lactobacillus colini TaxID=1819254 RepID=A0ABS4MF85_9LACO|nr:hypothetical protein [Lactobacillus colini]
MEALKELLFSVLINSFTKQIIRCEKVYFA